MRHLNFCNVVAASPRSQAPTADGSTSAAQLLSTTELAEVNERLDGPGLRQLVVHGAVLISGALLWDLPLAGGLGAGLTIAWPLRLLGLLLLGLGLAFGFCAMHECGHRTAFASRQLNDTVAWWAGVLSFYNADFYRRYHQWHHRYTHQVGLDPELEDSPPTTLAAYLLELSAIPWWIGKIRGHLAGWRGDFSGRPYISADAIPAVRRSIRCQMAVYGVLLLASLPAGNGLLFWGWLVPLAVAQPLLRFVMLAEHGGCPFVPDSLRNTRTTLTLAPLRWLMWQMPYHCEHHLYPSVPFHALARVHGLIAARIEHCDHGYLSVHRRFLADLRALALPPLAPASEPAPLSV